jgi:hypothetical protein
MVVKGKYKQESGVYPTLSNLCYKPLNLLVRRAKLGFVSRRQVPAPEVLARHRVPSVASLSVTPVAKRTQGGDGPQCESVKGLSPVMDVNCGCRRR